MDLLCFAKPFHHDGWALLRKAFSMMDWLCFAKPIHFDWIALLRKANPLWRIGMALLRKAIPVIQSRVSGRFLDFRSRCTVFFQVFAHMRMNMDMDMGGVY